MLRIFWTQSRIMAQPPIQHATVSVCLGANCSNLTDTIQNATDGRTAIATPIGYSVPHIILTSILISVIMVVIVFGNLLVVIAIFTDKNLKTTQNWFIASLAVADFLLGLVIMPFSLANEMMGYWYFGRIWCDLWKAVDVLLCTASILSICLISLDRYWSITRAIQYSRQRTGKRAALMIASVWFLSAIICVPPLIGWKNPLPVSDYPLCLLSDDIGYVLYSTMGSFYIPCVIMVFVYFKIYLAARRLARKNVKSKKNVKVQMKVEIKDDVTSNLPVINHENDRVAHKASCECHHEFSSDSAPESHSIEAENRHPNEMNRLLSPDKCNTEHSNTSTNHCTPAINSEASITTKSNNNIDNRPTDKVDSSTLMKSIGKRISKQRKPRNNGNKTSKGWRTSSLREHERQKKKIAKARERRATIVLGLVMAAFILCWFPFFTLYIITSFCYCIEEVVFTVVFWAGYCNSALNPIIYTIFNREFRQAFNKIIFRKILGCKRRL